MFLICLYNFSLDDSSSCIPKTECRFDNSNTEDLMECMSEEEKRDFGFDVRSIDWKDYIKNVHIPGVRRHLMKERRMPEIVVK